MTLLTRERKAVLRRTADQVGALGALYRLRDGAINMRAALLERDAALPPPRLRTLVAGRPEKDWFVRAGEAAAETISDIARDAGFDIDDPNVRVLEFGCGCGRVARNWTRPISGTDINPELVEWCANNLPGDYRTNAPLPPTGYPDAAFDIVYAVSVFTHLTEESQRAWLTEFGRIIRPGGILILTTHGDKLAASALTVEQRADYDRGRIVVCYPRLEGGNLCAAYHPAGALQALTDRFDLVTRRTDPVLDHDLNLLRRTP